MEIDSRQIGERIKNRRKELNITQDALSNMAGVSINQISYIENGHNLPTISTLIKLSVSLKVTPDYFLLGNTNTIDEAEISRIAEIIMLSNEKQQHLIYEFASMLHRQDF